MLKSEYIYFDALTGDDIQKAHKLLKGTYWASERTLEQVERSFAASLIIVAKTSAGELVGIARAITDRATISWICDVVVDEKHRGNEVGSEMVRRLLAQRDVLPTRKILVTKDAQSLYRKLGFATQEQKKGTQEQKKGTGYLLLTAGERVDSMRAESGFKSLNYNVIGRGVIYEKFEDQR